MSGPQAEDAYGALALAQRSAGTYLSNPFSVNFGELEQFQINVWVREVTGVAPSWVSHLETSTDGATWTAVPGSGTPALLGPGSATSNAQAPPNTITRVRTVISGVTVTMTGRAYVLHTVPL